MNPVDRKKAADVRALAMQFRRMAGETKLDDYISLMLGAAAELEDYAGRLEGAEGARLARKELSD